MTRNTKMNIKLVEKHYKKSKNRILANPEIKKNDFYISNDILYYY